jgi:hypothetical protein
MRTSSLNQAQLNIGIAQNRNRARTQADLFVNLSMTGTTESLDSVVFTFLHLGFIPRITMHFDDWHRLASMDDVWVDGVSVEVLDSFDCDAKST